MATLFRVKEKLWLPETIRPQRGNVRGEEVVALFLVLEVKVEPRAELLVPHDLVDGGPDGLELTLVVGRLLVVAQELVELAHDAGVAAEVGVELHGADVAGRDVEEILGQLAVLAHEPNEKWIDCEKWKKTNLFGARSNYP